MVRIVSAFSLAAVALATVPIARSDDGGQSGHAGGSAVSGGPAPCQTRVPQWVMETRKIICTEFRTEQRQRTISVCRPVTEDTEQTHTVMVPYQEERKATRCVYDT